MTSLAPSAHPVRLAISKSTDQWTEWTWQQSHAVRNVDGIKLVFPGLNHEACSRIEANNRHVRFQLTPYMLSLVGVDTNGVPMPQDPIWNMYVPTYEPCEGDEPISSLLADNWELTQEMINPILQHKYENRVNFRIQNRCLAYCNYCFEAKRVLDKDSRVGAFREEWFTEALNYIRNHEEVEEVVISGGEPLTLSNARLDDILGRIRAIHTVRALRLQTRAFTQNPFRVDEEFIRLLIRHEVSALGVHVSHPVEITQAFRDALDRLARAGCRTILLGQTPLLKGINDSAEILKDLFISLYALKVKPYYFLHAMPETLGSERFRTSVRKGVEIMMRLKRRISNPALPDYVIVHAKGKHTVPLEPAGTPEFQYVDRGVRFRNWKGEWCFYSDVEGV